MALPHPFDRLIGNLRGAIDGAANHNTRSMRNNVTTWMRWLDGYIDDRSTVDAAMKNTFKAMDDLAESTLNGAHNRGGGKAHFVAMAAAARKSVSALETALGTVTPNAAGVAADPMNGAPR